MNEFGFNERRVIFLTISAFESLSRVIIGLALDYPFDDKPPMVVMVLWKVYLTQKKIKCVTGGSLAFLFSTANLSADELEHTQLRYFLLRDLTFPYFWVKVTK